MICKLYLNSLKRLFKKAKMEISFDAAEVKEMLLSVKVLKADCCQSLSRLINP